MSAYDIQKLVEYRNISKWVKISTPSIYKKAIQLEEKGLIQGEIVKEGKMPEKAIYSLTEAGEAEFERLMFEISGKPINIFLDFNAVIVNLDSLPPEKQKSCIAEIEENISTLKSYLEHNIQKKENETIKKLFPTCESISIDYAVMEKAEAIYVLPASFGWSDLGTWGALRGLLPQDKSGNATVGTDIRLYDSKNCIVHASEEKRVVVQGLDGYIIAEKDNTLLICKLEEEQRIKEFSK